MYGNYHSVIQKVFSQFGKKNVEANRFLHRVNVLYNLNSDVYWTIFKSRIFIDILY